MSNAKGRVASRDKSAPTNEEIVSERQEDPFPKFQSDLDTLLNTFNEETTKLDVVKTINSLQPLMEEIAAEETASPEKSKETTEQPTATVMAKITLPSS